MKNKNKSAKKNSSRYNTKYEELNQVRKKKRFNWGRFFLIILILCIIFGSFFYLFHTRKVHIKGMNITTEKDVNVWLAKDKGNKNTLYSYVKMNFFDCKYPPTVEKIKVDFVNPWEINLNVIEKDISGYMDFQNKYLCFDDEGTAMYISDNPVDAVYVEGIKINTSKVKIGATIPVKDKNVFNNIVDISILIDKHKLSPDRIVCNGSNINIYFGDIEVMLGKSDYEIRIAQIPPILKELETNFSDEKGTLHLEKFHATDKTVRFVPKKED